MLFQGNEIIVSLLKTINARQNYRQTIQLGFLLTQAKTCLSVLMFCFVFNKKMFMLTRL